MKSTGYSLTYRVLTMFGIAVALAVFAATLGMDIAVGNYARANLRQKLEIFAEDLALKVGVRDDGQPVLRWDPSLARFEVEGVDVSWEVAREGYAPILSSTADAPIDHNALPIDADGRGHWIEVVRGGRQLAEYRYFVPGIHRPVPIRIAIRIDEAEFATLADDQRTSLRRLFFVVGFATFLISILLILYAFSPVRRLRQSVNELRMGELERLSGEFPAEVQPLIDEINILLAENAAMLQLARIKAANLAHGARTQLALLYGEAERVAEQGLPERAEKILGICETLQRRMDYHLARARAAPPALALGRYATIEPIAENLKTAMTRLHAGRNLKFDFNGESGLRVACDPLDLGEILANLVDNACKWAASTVAVSWRAEAGSLHIHVDDDGPGIAPDERDRVLQIGERLDDTKPGSGLGLPIVQNLCEIHQGSLLLEQSPLGGLRASVSIPLAGSQPNGSFDSPSREH